MNMSPELLTAIFAGITLLIYFTATIVGAVIAVFRKIDNMGNTIMADVALKHKENDIRHNALQALVIRHDTMLNPEFNGNFGHPHVKR